MINKLIYGALFSFFLTPQAFAQTSALTNKNTEILFQDGFEFEWPEAPVITELKYFGFYQTAFENGNPAMMFPRIEDQLTSISEFSNYGEVWAPAFQLLGDTINLVGSTSFQVPNNNGGFINNRLDAVVSLGPFFSFPCFAEVPFEQRPKCKISSKGVDHLVPNYKALLDHYKQVIRHQERPENGSNHVPWFNGLDEIEFLAEKVLRTSRVPGTPITQEELETVMLGIKRAQDIIYRSLKQEFPDKPIMCNFEVFDNNRVSGYRGFSDPKFISEGCDWLGFTPVYGANAIHRQQMNDLKQLILTLNSQRGRRHSIMIIGDSYLPPNQSFQDSSGALRGAKLKQMFNYAVNENNDGDEVYIVGFHNFLYGTIVGRGTPGGVGAFSMFQLERDVRDLGQRVIRGEVNQPLSN